MVDLHPPLDVSRRPARRDTSAHRAPRLLLPTLVLLTTTTSVITSLGGSLVPSVAVAHGVSLGSAQWILTGPMLVGALATPVLGRLGGTSRRRTVILASLGIVAVGLLLTTLPTGFSGLVAGRLLQGVGMGLLPLSLAAARDGLARERVPGALALLSVTATVGAGISYPLSAWIAHEAGVPAAYGVALGVTVLTWLLAWWAVPGSVTTGADTVHWLGAALLGGGTLLLLLALTQAPHLGAGSVTLWTLLVAGLVVVAAWVRVTLRAADPLVDLRLAVHRDVLPANISAFTAGTAAYMWLALVMIQVQVPTSTGFGLGLPVTVAGLALVPYALLSFFSSRLAAVVGQRIGLDRVLPCGAALYVVATAAYALAHDSIWTVAVVMALAGLGSGFTFAAMPGLVLRSTPLAETGSALSFNVLLRFLGFAAGSSLATSVLAFLTGVTEGADAFRLTVWINVGLWLTTALVSIVLIPSRSPAAQPKETS